MRIKLYLDLVSEFGIKIVALDFFEKLFQKINKKAYSKIHFWHYEEVKKILKKEFFYVIEEYKEYSKKSINNEPIGEKSIVWIFWWQGIDKAPDIVKKCICSIKQNVDNKVVLIDQYNYTNYIKLPNYIINAIDEKRILLANFSDILRTELLYQYGGVWIDSTIFLTQPLDKEIFKYPLYTIKHNLFSKWHVCKGMWSTFFLGACKNNVAVDFCRKMFLEYYKVHKSTISYFLIDSIIAIGYEELPFMKNMIDDIPINNEEVFIGSELLKRKYNKNNFNAFYKNSIYKLSYKEDYNSTKNSLFKEIMER